MHYRTKEVYQRHLSGYTTVHVQRYTCWWSVLLSDKLVMSTSDGCLPCQQCVDRVRVLLGRWHHVWLRDSD